VQFASASLAMFERFGSSEHGPLLNAANEASSSSNSGEEMKGPHDDADGQ
jgi:hypothetical protein